MRPPRPIAIILAAVLASACARDDQVETLYGVGASAPAAALDALGAAYAASPAGRGVRVDYLAAGSGAGLRLVRDDVVDFAATEEPLATAASMESAARTFAVPVALGALAVVANLPGGAAPCLSPAELARTLRGDVADWSELSGGTLEGAPVRVATRADSSGSSAALMTYLATVDPELAARAPSAVRLAPASGVAVRGTEGMIAYVRSASHSLGYAEVSAARRAGLAVLPLRAPSGACIEPTRASIERAARVCPPEGAVGRCDAASRDAEAYPLVTVTYVTGRSDGARARRVGDLVRWTLDEGGPVLADSGMLALSDEWAAHARRALGASLPTRSRSAP